MFLHIISTRGTDVYFGSLSKIETVIVNSDNANHSDLVLDENQNARNSITKTIKISRSDLIAKLKEANPSPRIVVTIQETS